MKQEIRSKYRAVIGLEVHAQLLTKSKIFTSDSNNYHSSPNTNISAITLGHPGVLPKLNKKVIELAIKMGLACECEIADKIIFDRKNYFYPDLPKGYQITQDKFPICTGGRVFISEDRSIALDRIHLEEDAGKSIHLPGEEDTLIDFNRAGVPLIEIVTRPDLHTAAEAATFLTEIRKLVRYLEICDGNMEQGSLRCDANVSVMKVNSTIYGKKVEVKNMNSIKNVERAVDYEIARQIEILEQGNEVISETRTFDAASGMTRGMRTKEELNDYRYFPDPDLSPVVITREQLDSIKKNMPPLPRQLFRKFINVYQISEYDAGVLTDTKDIALFYEEVVQVCSAYKAASNWVMGPVKSYLNEQSISIDKLPIKPGQLAELIRYVEEGQLSFSAASQFLFPALLNEPVRDINSLMKELDLHKENDSSRLESVIEEILLQFPDKVMEYKKGKKGIIGMFIGQIMKKTNGKADPKVADEILREKLEA